MNIRDALSTFQFTKKKKAPNILFTVWGEHINKKKLLSEYPRPQFERSQWINLNGYWNYAFTRGNSRPTRFDGKILVPFSPEAPLSEVCRQLLPNTFLWYHRCVSLEEIPDHKRLLLQFGAVDQECFIYWNGNLAGTHKGGYLSFTVDVTKFIHLGNNSLWIKVSDESDRSWQNRGKQKLKSGGMFYTAQSGVWQTVWMEWVSEDYIRSIRLTPLYDTCQLSLQVEADIINKKEVWIYADETLLCKTSFHGETTVISLPQRHDWSPEDPFLYHLEIRMKEDKVKSYFALRKFSVSTDENHIPRLCLNNQPYFQNGVLDQGYWPDGLYTAPSDEAMIYDIQTMKSLGFNMIRKHLKIEPMRWYYHCDRLGMIVWQDMINGGGRSFMTFLCYLPTALPFVTRHFKDNHYLLFSRTSKEGKNQWLKECKETIEQLYNCPCICLWTAFNEGWGQFDAKMVSQQIKLWDKTRLIDPASGWYDQKCGDVKSIHNYFRPLTVSTEKRPVVFSEYGGYTCYIPKHSYSDQIYGYRNYTSVESLCKAFKKLQTTIAELKKQGLSAAVYTQVSDVEEEVNGLLTYDRKYLKTKP